MSKYWKRLKTHPGVPMATFSSTLGVVLAITDGIWVAIPVMSIWWIPVLITARTQPLPQEQSDE